MKENCWEYMKCGREPGGQRADEFSVCRVTTDSSFERINSGKNGGRFCWAIAGTLSKNEVDGFFARDKESCTDCIFYQNVMAEEGSFNLRTKFLRFVFSEEGSILDSMEKVKVSAGERFIEQGRYEETAYIVERGSQIAYVEKDGKLHPINHYSVGDIIGGLGILTGTPRLVSVEAETDSELWMIRKEIFERISEKDTELRLFLTELAASRFDLKRPVSERKIGKFTAKEIIGRGGYSIVYKGNHESLDIPVVIKMMRHDLAMDEEFIKKFRSEAHMIARFNNENIIRVYDIEEIYKTVFIVMEYIDGESLKSIIESENPLPFDKTLNIMTQVLNGLSYAHKKGIVHRDINPDNVMVTKDNKVKILDFGLACPLGTEDFDLTGTLCYMAKEQIDGEAVDQRSDIYSAAVMAYEMITGERPFTESDFTKLMDPDVRCDIPDPEFKRKNVPELLRNFVLKAGSSNPSDRFKDADEALYAISQDDLEVRLKFDSGKKEEVFSVLEEIRKAAEKKGIGFVIEEGPGK